MAQNLSRSFGAIREPCASSAFDPVSVSRFRYISVVWEGD
jgi:hypothetical protein